MTLVQARERLTSLQQAWAHRVVLTRDAGTDVLVKLAALHRVRPAAAAVSFTEDFLLAGAMITEHLGVAGNPLAPVRATRDKLQMRDLLSSHPDRTVAYAACATAADVRAFAECHGYPVVVKPTSGVGSRGVTLVEGSRDIDRALARSREAFRARVIVEAYVLGSEVSVETLTVGGEHEVLAITEKLTTGPPNFVEIGHQMPARRTPTPA